MITKSICLSHIFMRSYREIVSFVNVSPIDAFDVFESYDVFRFAIRAYYALVLSIYFCKHELRYTTSKDLGTIWWPFAWPLLYSMYYNN